MKKIIVLCMTIALMAAFNGCKKEEFLTEELPEGISQEEVVFKEGQMIMGEQLENPYSVENMKRAYDNLQAENILKSKIKVETTHYYVRFRPKTMQELDMITRDTTLDIYDYPLDIDIKRGGTHYHDPSIPSNEITWQYTVVPADYTFPKIQHQKLAKLYLPEEGGELTEVKSASIEHFDWLQLEKEALLITNNLSEEEMSENALKSSNWRPAGTIKVWDDVINSHSSTIKVFDHYEYYNCETGNPVDPPSDGDYPVLKSIAPPDENICSRAVYRYLTNTTNSHYIPMEGVEVRATRWFTTHKGYTDVNGNFTCDGTFTYGAKYSIKWERWDFDIRDRWWGQAYYNTGEKVTSDWNLNIHEDYTPKSFNIAHIFRAAHTYYYKHNSWGIKAPPRRDGILQLLQHRLHIASIDNPGTSMYLTFMEFALAAQVLVHDNGNSQRTFATTIHELAHASHWELGYSTEQYLVDYIFNHALIPESWADCVEHVITSSVYSNNWEDNQWKKFSDISNGYTPLFIDLIDDENQRDKHSGNTNYPIDRVYGYTLSQLENVLDKTYINLGLLEILEPLYESFAIGVYKNKLRDTYSNSSEGYIDELFGNYY